MLCHTQEAHHSEVHCAGRMRRSLSVGLLRLSNGLIARVHGQCCTTTTLCADPPTPAPAASRATVTSTFGGDDASKIIGRADVGVRDNRPFIYERNEFVGDLTPLMRPRTDAGKVLAMIDICAGRAAGGFITGKPYAGGLFKAMGSLSLATVSFNSFTFTQPIFEGDLIMINASVIHTGSSSVGVHACVSRQAFDCPEASVVGESYVTMVTVSAQDISKSCKGLIPAVRLSTALDIQCNAAYTEMRSSTALLADTQEMPCPDGAIELPINMTKSGWARIADTVVTVHRVFNITDVNANNAIFGGAVLRFMERTALHCGRVFARKANLFTLAMLGMTFDNPMFLQDLATCEARVLCVRRSTLLVNVRISANNNNGELRTTNEASFVLVAIDETGKPLEIPRGIDLTDATPEERQLYRRARCMLERSAKLRSCAPRRS